MSAASTQVEGRDPVEELVESFLERRRRGERPSIEEYAAGHPDLAEIIRDLFPALLALEDHGPDTKTERASSAPMDDGCPARMGEYRILRRIGRGGMGMVYEAEQETLGRHVALKVLSRGAVADPVQMERFRQEARAAARLHHTNIVPVFGIGEDGGILYYSMQYIRGHTMADVLSEVKGMRRAGKKAGEAPAAAEAAATASGLVGEAFESDAYSRSVARLGLQVTEALAYAHGEGVFHRDIKPSNLILDQRGTVWVADFGLAKTGESADLTASGDVVGTLRYMAPERFEGCADARSDIFSLGVTLYEILTLRPAFEGNDRAQLIRDITSRDPPRPRRIDPHIPRDLETIILKASARLPQDRYRSAALMAEDLRRFLNGEPVSARRATPAERFWRLCQRNPVIAFLIAGIASLGITLVVGAAISTAKLRVERDTAFHRLVAAKLEEGRAWRRSRAPGQRSRALKALQEAAPGASPFEMRNEIIGSLALVDLVEENPLESREVLLARDDGLTRWATRGPKNSLLIYEDASREQPLASLGGGDIPVEEARFSPSGRYAVVRYGGTVAGPPLQVWDIDQKSLVLELERPARGMPVAFRGDEAELAAPASGIIQVWSFPEGRVLRSLERSPNCRELAFDPLGRRLAVAGDGDDTHVARVIDAADGSVLARLHHPDRVGYLAWHPDKDLLAAACFDFNVYLWDPVAARRLHVLTGHSAEVVRVGFTYDGELLASSGWDEQTFLWDPASGRDLISLPGYLTAFSRSDRRLGFRIGDNRGGTWKIEGGTEHRTLRVPGPRTEKLPHKIAISPDGRWLVAECGSEGARLWCAVSPRLSVDLQVGKVHDVAFHPDGSILTSGSTGIERWPLREEEPGKWTVGPSKPMGISGGRFSLDSEGRLLAILSGYGIAVHDLAAGKEVARLEHRAVHRTHLSSSGRWMVSTTWKGAGIRVWDARSGELLKELPGGSAHAAFSPDERLLAVGLGVGFEVFETGKWGSRYRIGTDREGDLPRMVAFSSDSRLLALAREIGKLTIHLAETGEEVARFEAPGGEKISSTVFNRSGSFLAWASPGNHSVVLWDLGMVRRELAALGLDWDSSPVPAAEGALPQALRLELGSRAPRPASGQYERRTRDLAVLEALTSRLEFEPTPAAYAERADLHRRLGAQYEALADLDHAIADSSFAARAGDQGPGEDAGEGGRPEQLRWLRVRADLRRRTGQWQLAREDLERIVELNPEDAPAARELAFCLCLEPADAEGKNSRRALELAEKSAQSEPRVLPALKALAAAFYRLDRLEEAEEALRKALDLTKGPVPDLKLFLAMIYHRSGRSTEARRSYDEAKRWLDTIRFERGTRVEGELLRAEAERLLGAH